MSGLWRFDYAAAERKRFTGKEVWDPTRISDEKLDTYLIALSYNWGPKSGLTEEIALKYLASHEYEVEKTILETLQEPTILKALIRESNRLAEKIETIAFIGSLLD